MRLLAGLVALAIAPLAWGQNVCTNGSFDQDSNGWGNAGGHAAKGVTFDWQKEGGRNGTGAIHVRAEDSVTERGPWIWSQTIDAPKAKALKLSVWIHGKRVSELAAVCIQAWKEGNESGGFATTQTASALKGDFDWTKAEAVLAPEEGTSKLIVMAFIAGTGEAWFDDLTLEPTDAAPPTPAATPAPKLDMHDVSKAGEPGLFMVRGGMELTALQKEARPKFVLPLPMCYREQVPLSFRIVTTPEDRFASLKLRPDTTGGLILEGEVKPIAPGETVEVRWESMVLCGPRQFGDVPKSAPVPAEWPDEARPWLAPTWCVQAMDDRIQRVAERVRGDGADVMEIIDRACLEAQKCYGSAKGQAGMLTAVEALTKRGSCTSCANLVAALLRGAGVPARVLAGYPVWSGPLQTHYIVEAWVPAYGWYPIESTMLKHPWPPFGQIAVRIIPPDDEDEKAGPRFPNAAGVPYLSLTEYVGYDQSFIQWGIVDRRTYCDHEAALIRPLKGTSRQWAAAVARSGQRWHAWVSSAKGGGVRPLAAPAETDTAQDPEALAK